MKLVTTSALNVIFAGTPHFAEVTLEALIGSSHQVLAVYTQPDRPSGRGLKLTPSPVKVLAEKHNLPVYQPVSLKESHEQDILAAFNADVMVVAAYGLLLPSKVLAIPRLGCINIHPSLLPRWRGAAPIQRTLYAGDSVTGVSIMQMEAGLDTGPVLLQHEYRLAENETSQTLHDVMATMGAKALLETLDLLVANQLTPKIQDNAKATYAHKISKEEALIDWERPAIELENEIRAFNPWPVAYTSWQEKSLRIWMAKAIAVETDASPRTVVGIAPDGIDIAAGVGVLRLQKVQLPGGKILEAHEFYHARQHEIGVGKHFI